MDYMNTNEVFSVYGVYPKGDGTFNRKLLGRFVTNKGKIAILEDHWILEDMIEPGPIAGKNERALNSLANSPYMEVVSDGDVAKGHHLELIPEKDFGNGPKFEGAPQLVESPLTNVQTEEEDEPTADNDQFHINPPPPVFDYFRTGMTKPQILEVDGNDVYMNGHKLDPDEAERILDTVRSGLATLRYRRKV